MDLYAIEQKKWTKIDKNGIEKEHIERNRVHDSGGQIVNWSKRN